MRYCIFFAIPVMAALALSTHTQGQAEADINYECVFNVQFDRQQFPVRYHARLLNAGIASYFDAVRDKTFAMPATDDLSMEPDTLLQVSKHFEADEMLFAAVSFSGKQVLYRDTLHSMTWILTDEKKSIDSLECFQARTRFRGRNYVAWYAPSIPLPNGPWKLGGLPGLIIEAYEENRDLYFLARSVQFRQTDIPLRYQGSISRYPGFPEYVTYLKTTLEKIEGAMAAQEVGNCIDCQTRSKVKLYLWEKVLD
jgi:GLPGLI family protein